MSRLNLSPHVTRKELAEILGDNISPSWIKRHEQDTGLHRCRVKKVRQPVIYRTREALKVLLEYGFDISRARTLVTDPDR